MQNKLLISGRISATLTLPNTVSKVPIILFLHGFGTNKNEVGNTFLVTAEKLMAQKIGSLRIDFSGCGESLGKSSNITIEKFIADASLALDYILSLDCVDIKRVGVCGFSLGAGISILLTQFRPEIVKSMALLSPAGDLSKDFNAYFGDDKFKLLEKAKSEMELDLGWRKIKLKSKFIKSLKKYSLMESVRYYSGAFFVIAGANDFSKSHAQNYLTNVASLLKEIIIVEDNDHIFCADDSDKSNILMVTNEVTSWFKKTL